MGLAMEVMFVLSIHSICVSFFVVSRERERRRIRYASLGGPFFLSRRRKRRVSVHSPFSTADAVVPRSWEWAGRSFFLLRSCFAFQVLESRYPPNPYFVDYRRCEGRPNVSHRYWHLIYRIQWSPWSAQLELFVQVLEAGSCCCSP